VSSAFLDALRAGPKRALLVGMGVTNRAVAGALLRRGHQVTAVDDRPDDLLRGAASDLGLELIDGPTDADLHRLVDEADFVVPAPGLPERHVAFAAADAAGREVVSELDLAAAWDQRPIAAVTGTNGKTTVVEMSVDALLRSGIGAVAAGNTDVPLVVAIDEPATDVFVVEASSFRLARVRDFQPFVGTWLNFAPDHLDIHPDLEAYETAKAKIFSSIAPGGTAVANALDPVVMRHVPIDRTVVTFGGPAADWRVEGDKLSGPDGPFLTTDRLWRSLPHDVEDVLAVAATIMPLGADLDAVAATAETFAGLPHRVSPVAEVDGSMFYDDSKSTTPHATLAALRGFDSVVLIAGGRNKGIDLGVLAAGGAHIHAVVAIGEAADEIAAVFDATHPVSRATDMDSAVATARALAAGGRVVLLSPACASFDWYGGYGERGDDFARSVRSLGGST
jgi:UDP-N-acetylmuramoylalanine--D-glutamate ligase